jgi:hypothetical protein
MVKALERELFGPDPAGSEIAVETPLSFDGWKAAEGPFRQARGGDEILTRDVPIKRYGLGVLFPLRSRLETTSSDSPLIEEDDAGLDEANDIPGDEGEGALEVDVKAEGSTGIEAEDEEFDLSTANAYQPSSLGVSCLIELPEGAKFLVEVTGGRYRPKSITVRLPNGDARERTWWIREAIRTRETFEAGEILNEQVASRRLDVDRDENERSGLDLRVEVFSRPRPGNPRLRLITICLVNRTEAASERSSLNRQCLFQSKLRAWVEAGHGVGHILPYPAPPNRDDDEELGLELLYRQATTFATGHGCAADWEAEPGSDRARAVIAECLPRAETRAITPDIRRADGSPLTVSMAALAGLVQGDDGRAQLEEIVALYRQWIEAKRAEISSLNEQYRDVANKQLDACTRAASRMRDGIEYLCTDSKAQTAFQLANHAILLQQIATQDGLREAAFDARSNRLTFSPAYAAPSPAKVPPGRGTWRAFQIAFLLATIRSTAEGDAPDRDTVELIWFPTGGGKTEAYLGLAAFAMFKRRLENPNDAGVHVLTRYTLRLLTAQQFQRSAGLLCAMEYLRRAQPDEFGTASFSAGIWLGGETTPNKRDEARRKLRELEDNSRAENPFLLTRCPWCRAQFGARRLVVGGDGRGRRGRPQQRTFTFGYRRQSLSEGGSVTVRLHCPDPACEFKDGLPVYVIDEDIYEVCPTLVIGTIDKFAMLAWRPVAARLFGLDRNGKRICSPPGLIIQDELHLISGPLGSMAGLYETTIEELCTDDREAKPVRPKIVSSTATIRRYPEQIQALYARIDTALFPPPGLDAGDSFFARYDTSQPGRMYVGVHATSLGSVQTEWVRTLTALIQAPMELTGTGPRNPERSEARDPWWTLVVFFNSLREMGTAHTLFQSDVPDYLEAIWARQGTDRDRRRYLYPERIFELTGGLPSNEISGAIDRLATRYEEGSSGRAEDVCLASNIIEVGIDIGRLSLMVVAGQPKTTSQYIQVTGRVGRERGRPGLVVTMYSASKPRDRSHYERFRSYHERLYAWVEPTSVTPFSPPALDRALHAALVAYARLRGGRELAQRPRPFRREVVDRFLEIALFRVGIVDDAERPNVEAVLRRRAQEWERWDRKQWRRGDQDQEDGQLRVPGEYATDEETRYSWATPTSMRNVDAECRAEITRKYSGEVSDGA